MNKFDVKKICYVATDSIGRVMKDTIINMTVVELELQITISLTKIRRN